MGVYENRALFADGEAIVRPAAGVVPLIFVAGLAITLLGGSILVASGPPSSPGVRLSSPRSEPSHARLELPIKGLVPLSASLSVQTLQIARGPSTSSRSMSAPQPVVRASGPVIRAPVATTPGPELGTRAPPVEPGRPAVPSPSAMPAQPLIADPRVTISVDRTRANPGDKLTYVVAIASRSDTDQDLTVYSHIPAKTTEVVQGGCTDTVCAILGDMPRAGVLETRTDDPSAHGFARQLRLGAHGMLQITFVVRIDADSPPGTTIANHAHVAFGKGWASSNDLKTVVG